MVSSASATPATLACDVLVLGGGPSGIGAAIAAARMGTRTMLVERHDVLGGMGTAALVNNFCPAHLDGSRLIIGGVFADLRQRLIERRALHASENFAYGMEAYHPGVFAELAATLCRDADVTVLFNRALASATASGPRLLATFDDGTEISAATAVDATGDASLAALVGAPFLQRPAATRAVMPLTYCYKMGPVDLDLVAKQGPGWLGHNPSTGEPTHGACAFGQEEIKRAKAAGELSIPRDDVAAILSVPGEPENVTVNFGRVFVQDPTDPAQLAAADAEGRRQVEEGLAFFKKYFPAYREVRLLELARQIGVRESRQLAGRYTLVEDDVVSCRQFEDVIAQCCYGIDIHDPHGGGTKLVEIPRGQHYDIPLRCLIPASGPANLLVAGRAISADQAAMSSFRVSPSAMAIGEAAGVTAALAAQSGCAVAAVPASAVQARLRATGGILE